MCMCMATSHPACSVLYREKTAEAANECMNDLAYLAIEKSSHGPIFTNLKRSFTSFQITWSFHDLHHTSSST